MKYVIDIPDDTQKIIGFRQDYSLIYVDMTPYTEPDRQVIENEVWRFAWEVLQLDLPVFREIFGYDTDKMDYRKVKSKYEEWKKQKDEIHVGDEVEENTGLWKGVIVGFDESGDLVIMDRSGKSCGGYKTRFFRKTGRHFDEVEELLKKMGDEK